MQWLLSAEPKQQQCPVPLVEDLLVNENFLSAAKYAWLMQAMQVSKEQIDTVAKLTVGQRNNVLWCSLRKLRFTASRFGDILRATTSWK